MPASPRDILRRIRGIKSTQQITKAMEMVSAVKLTRVRNQAENARGYVDAMGRMVRILCTTAGDSEHELFREREQNTILLIVLTSDRGLCGTFNTSVINAVEAFRQEHAGKNITFMCIGRKGAEALARTGASIEEALDTPWGTAISKEVERINYNALGAFEARRYDAVYLLYSRFENVLVYKPTVVQHLPVPRLSAEEAKSLAKWAVDFLLEPNFDALANALIPQYLETQLHYALVESLASEYAARMVAMRNANDNAEEVIGELNLSYNKARQATITRDLIDIIGGVEALNG
ncbi:MAG: ATP synthase F1 subunit gamma [Deltaproteobacteria bacterium]|nr:ATP synthase F1 subunit gamma [Deltaproteobacteria bacterium]